MNFLAHYYTGKNHPSVYFKTGLVLPDLTRNYHKELKLRESHTLVNHNNDLLILLNDGIKHHLLVDASFHNSKFFKNALLTANNSFKDNNFNTADKYLYFISHVLVELLIDRFIINTHPEICDDFYHSLSSINDTDLEDFFRNIGLEAHNEGFFMFLNKFREVQYARHYTNNERLLFALNRIYTRATGKELENDKHIIYQTIEEIEEKINSDIPHLLTSLSAEPGLF